MQFEFVCRGRIGLKMVSAALAYLVALHSTRVRPRGDRSSVSNGVKVKIFARHQATLVTLHRRHPSPIFRAHSFLFCHKHALTILSRIQGDPQGVEGT
jgi:hypothetical protein